MKQLVLTIGMIVITWTFGIGQTMEEMEATKAAKEAELKALQPQADEMNAKVKSLSEDIAALTDKLTPYPRWDIGASGNLGFSFSSFSDWLSKAQPNTTAITIGLSAKGNAHLQQRKYFWRNNANLTLGWLKFNDREDPTDSKDFKVSADALNATSLFGYKLTEKIAASVLGEYRTSMLDDKFNNPGYLDLGAGATWTPMKDLVVVVHPLDYNFIFSSGDFDYKSSFGCKIVADYKLQLSKGIAWKSNVSAFASYKDSDLSNWTWVNGFTTAVKGFGLGLDIGLRGNKQEALAAGKTDNPVQSYWIIGLSYAL